MKINDLKTPEAIDRHFGWSIGRTRKLAMQGELPHYILPDGSIRLRLAQVQALIRRVQLKKCCRRCGSLCKPPFKRTSTGRTICSVCASQAAT